MLFLNFIMGLLEVFFHSNLSIKRLTLSLEFSRGKPPADDIIKYSPYLICLYRVPELYSGARVGGGQS